MLPQFERNGLHLFRICQKKVVQRHTSLLHSRQPFPGKNGNHQPTSGFPRNQNPTNRDSFGMSLVSRKKQELANKLLPGSAEIVLQGSLKERRHVVRKKNQPFFCVKGETSKHWTALRKQFVVKTRIERI